MFGLDGDRELFEGGGRKAGNIGATLLRFGQYFGQNLVGVMLALILIFLSTWTQVVTPEYIGQSVDCYLFPQATSNCWFDSSVQAAIQSGTLDTITTEAKLIGLGNIVLILVGLFIAGSVVVGLAFYT